MGKKVVLLLQGGGALGAFQFGAWRALERFLREEEHELIAVAGASIGAVNAALIARHLHDEEGATPALERFWSRDAPNPPLPFIPFPGEYWRAWNGLLTGLLTGNPALFRPLYQYWTPVGDMLRFWMPLYDVGRSKQTLSAAFGRYRGNAPLLAVAATDVQSGEAVLFDSAQTHVTPTMLAASTAIPVLFSPVEIGGRYFWDGEIRSESLLPHVLARLHTTLPARDTLQDLLVIVVDMFNARAGGLPSSTISAQYRMLNIILGGKLAFDLEIFKVRNAYVDAVTRLHAAAREHETPPALMQQIEADYRRLLDERIGHIDVVRISRAQFEYEHISRDFDYSPQYLERLTEQGEARATEELREYREGGMQQRPLAKVTPIRSRRQ
ncbi:MAG TPA: patatin-like phospholipase family protein [Noviherbaspirillum sp.]|nr:patatin-like phospholipase family protein [Noviherbaspirillum sp.]